MSDFRNQIANPAERSMQLDTNIFDWQVTPFPAVVAYIRRDFRRVMERGQLTIKRGGARNAALGTSHLHSFHASGDILSQQDITDQYSQAREKFDHLAAKFRAVLASEGPIVYAFFCSGRTPSFWQIAAFFRCVRRRNPKQSFRLAIIGVEGKHKPPLLLWFAQRVSWHTVAPSAKEGIHRWEGDDESWEKVIEALQSLRF